MWSSLFLSTVRRERRTVEGLLEIRELSAWGSAEKPAPRGSGPWDAFALPRICGLFVAWLEILPRGGCVLFGGWGYCGKPLVDCHQGSVYSSCRAYPTLHSSKFKIKSLFYFIPQLLLSMRRRALQGTATGCPFWFLVWRWIILWPYSDDDSLRELQFFWYFLVEKVKSIDL